MCGGPPGASQIDTDNAAADQGLDGKHDAQHNDHHGAHQGKTSDDPAFSGETVHKGPGNDHQHTDGDENHGSPYAERDDETEPKHDAVKCNRTEKDHECTGTGHQSTGDPQ